MKRFINVTILIGEMLFGYVVIKELFPFNCIFKKYLGIGCPGCGLTRSFLSILRLDFKNATYYNILGIPLFIVFVIGTISLIIDTFKNSDNTIIFIKKIFSKYYVIIVLILIVTMIINNIHGI